MNSPYYQHTDLSPYAYPPSIAEILMIVQLDSITPPSMV